MTDAEKCLEQYISVATWLVKNGYYNWLRKVISDCFKCSNTFIVFDCPSGSGKTQAGMALLVLARLEVEICDRRLIAAHIVWESSVADQVIYSALQADQRTQSICVEGFFTKGKRWLEMSDRL